MVFFINIGNNVGSWPTETQNNFIYDWKCHKLNCFHTNFIQCTGPAECQWQSPLVWGRGPAWSWPGGDGSLAAGLWRYATIPRHAAALPVHSGVYVSQLEYLSAGTYSIVGDMSSTGIRYTGNLYTGFWGTSICYLPTAQRYRGENSVRYTV